MGERSAWVTLRKARVVGCQSVQLVVSGVSGVNGAPVLSPVEEDHNLLAGKSNSRQLLGEMSVKVSLGKTRNVGCRTVQFLVS